ncbi:MAG TPA: rod shape-determining protein RodA [Desulfobacteraceae bacterium]|nr:rod shape-determining protein RodA [Desulfobacteraceae bacterium]
MFDRRLIQHFDWVLLLLVVMIAGIGVLNLYSATYPIRNMGGGAVFIRHLYWLGIGFIVFFIMTTFNYYSLERLAFPFYFVLMIMLVVVLISGRVIAGSQRWLSIGFVSFQPSEFAKIALVMTLAKYFSDQSRNGEYRLRDLVLPAVIAAVPAVLIIKEPDLGTALLLLAIASSMILLFRVNIKSVAIVAFSVVAVAPFIWTRLKEYQQVRILSFLKPEMDPLGSGYHIAQSKIAIGSGQFWGKGFLKGTQTRLHFLPEQHTDFAFSVLGEEWGFLGSFILLILFLMLVLWGLGIARNSKDKFGAMMAVGIVAIVFWQVAINVGMVTGLLPVVGIPLMFLSYGGSSMVTTMAALGLLMNISMRRFMFQ